MKVKKLYFILYTLAIIKNNFIKKNFSKSKIFSFINLCFNNILIKKLFLNIFYIFYIRFNFIKKIKIKIITKKMIKN